MEPRAEPTAESGPLDPPALVAGADVVVRAVGRFDLRGAELRAVRLTLAPGGVPTLEVDLHLPTADPGAELAPEYRVTLRCTDVADLGLADFEHQNVVGDWTVEPLDPGTPDGRAVRVAIMGDVGCDLELRCTAIAVVGVTAVPLPRTV